MKAIETRYAGHRFRSRTEARWAVFFDRIGIRWEYELEGYRIGPDSRPYLPDFHLPKEDLWVEVKGAEEQLDVELMVQAATPSHGLPGGRQIDGYDVRLVILGYPGRPRAVRSTDPDWDGFAAPAHSALAFRDGTVYQWATCFRSSGLDFSQGSTVSVVATEADGVDWEGRSTTWGNFVGGGLTLSNGADERVVDAYNAARSARFEHGESGAPR